MTLLALVAGFRAVAAAPAKTKAPPVARVVIMQDTNATATFTPNPEVVRRMVDQGVEHLTGKTNLVAAWRSLVSTNDVVGLKVFSAPGGTTGTRPAVAGAVAESLIAAGLPATNVIIWDKQMSELVRAGFGEVASRVGVRLASSADAGYDEKTFYDSSILGQLVFGDLEFGRKGEGIGRKSFVSKLVTKEMTKIITITPMLNHNLAGVTGNLLSLALGSVDNTLRFESDPVRLDTAVPEICALPILGDRVPLNIVDGLICQYEGEQRSLLHYSEELNQLRFSTDPVALDVLSIEEMKRLRALHSMPPPKVSLELYKNASLVEVGISERKNIKVDTYP